MARIGILGGSFNPPHAAHLLIAERAMHQHRLDRVLFVPALRPPHRQPKVLASADHRLRMLELATAGNPAFQIDPLELERDPPSYTLQTVAELRERLGPDAELFLILGSDSVADIANWWRARELAAQVRVITAERPGCSFREARAEFGKAFGAERANDLEGLRLAEPLPDVSSTAVRERVAAGLPIDDLVPASVRDYIGEHGLYSRR